VRCNEIQGAEGVETAEATSLASGRNADGSDTRYFFADDGVVLWMFIKFDDNEGTSPSWG